jgi:hypothetical protein
MEWFWWILLVAGYVLGSVYFGTLFEARCARRCEMAHRGGLWSGACSHNTSAAMGYALWPVWWLVTLPLGWLYQLAKRQSAGFGQARSERRITKSDAERRAIEAETALAEAKTALARAEEERDRAQLLAMDAEQAVTAANDGVPIYRQPPNYQ